MRERLEPTGGRTAQGIERRRAGWLLTTAMASCVTALVVGCGAAAAERATVAIAEAAPDGCTRKGVVHASANRAPSAEGNMEAARDELRSQAAELGANVVVIDQIEDKQIVVRLAGTAYQCP